MIKLLLSTKDLSDFFIEHDNDCVRFPELDSLHRENDQKISMHPVYFGRENNNAVCIVADDMDTYLSLINICHHTGPPLYFRQGKTKDKDGVNYHDTNAIAVNLGKEISQILSCFHTLTGSGFNNLFIGCSKIKASKKKFWKHQNPTSFY